MFERLRELFPLKDEKPKDWEDVVLNSYKILKNQIQLAEEAKIKSNFLQEEHASRIKTRVNNLKSIVLDSAARERSLLSFPQFLELEVDQVPYFYYPGTNTLGHAKYMGVGSPIGFGFYPASDVKSDVNYTTWCLNKGLVENLALNLIGLLPTKSSIRILAQAA